MNERIKELEIQCWEPRQYGPAWFNSTKFAELILRECIKRMDEDDGATYHGDLLLDYFGVKNAIE